MIIGVIGIIIGNGLINAANPTDDVLTDNLSIGNSTSGVTEPYQTVVTACEIAVILAITLYGMKKLFSTGVVSKFDEEDEGGI
jgi:hypothetical protein